MCDAQLEVAMSKFFNIVHHAYYFDPIKLFLDPI